MVTPAASAEKEDGSVASSRSGRGRASPGRRKVANGEIRARLGRSGVVALLASIGVEWEGGGAGGRRRRHPPWRNAAAGRGRPRRGRHASGGTAPPVPRPSPFSLPSTHRLDLG
uniref:Uncharacterized protein n=1 Tax=Arundo donax TaxID=35708 RepID=A0A0A8ZQL9_ARUDO